MTDKRLLTTGTMRAVRAPHIKRVIVIGAGLAGLGVAQALNERDYEVIVLEARDRTGGRCHTKNGIDYGAHWIHGTEGNPVTTLARQLNVNTLFVGGDSTYTGGWNYLTLHGRDGRTFDQDEKLNSILLADEVWDELDSLRREQAGKGDVALRTALNQVLADRRLTDTDRAAIDWHLALLARDDCAADLDTLSFQAWDEGYEVYGYGDSVLLDGYSALTRALADGLKIHLEHVVLSIRYGGERGVEVATNRGIFTADAAIVTLPLGVLKAGAVRFDPPLPAAKQAAIARLGVGCLAKVVARFDEPFWSPDQYVFGYRCQPVADRPTILVNMWKTHAIPALVMLIGGEAGRAVESWTEAQTRDWTMGVLRDVFGPTAPQPLAIARTDWTLDPYARGAYSYIAVGASPADIETLAAPVADRVFFAGEATYRHHWGTTHGAYASAMREAARISGDVSLLPVRHASENRRWREMMLRITRFLNVMTAATDEAELQERLAVLSESEVFSVVPPAELRLLASMFEAVSFANGAVVCREGDPATQMYMIVSGLVEVSLSDGSVVNHLRRGDVVGDYGMFGAHVRTATVTSRGESRALTLDYQRFRRFLLAFPEASVALLGSTVERLMAVIHRLAEDGG